MQNVFEHARPQPRALVARYGRATDVNAVHQADLLELPQDPDGSRYALVVVDLGTRRVAARPLAVKTAAATKQALQHIYDNDPVLKPPQRMEVDAGREFAGAFKTYLDRAGTVVRYGEPGRHRQQALVESVNGILGRAIWIFQSGREMRSGRPDRRWADKLPEFVEAINEELERLPPDPAAPDLPPPANAMDAALLAPGTVVRRRLEPDRGQDVLGNALQGRRRAGDPTYEPRTRKIEDIVLRPGMSPRYVLEGLPHVSYARYELQVVPQGERLPPAY